MWVRSLGREGPLEKEMATHSGIFAWKIPWTEEPGGLQSIASQRVRHDCACAHEHTPTNVLLYIIYVRYAVRSNRAEDVLGDPVAKTLCSQCRALGFDLWSGNQTPLLRLN